MRLVDRQFDVAAIRKLQISQTDAKTALPAAAALDHVARADREPAGETVCKGTHEYPPESKKPRLELSGTNVRTPRRFRDSLATSRDFCESLWTKLPCPNAYVHRSEPGVQEFQNAARSFRRLMSDAA